MAKRRYVNIPKTIASLVQPAVLDLAGRLFVLTTGRRGSKKYRPTVMDFYETGIVSVLYEHMLMTPSLQHMDIRHEMPYPGPGRGAPRRVDLWLRPFNGGYPHLIEAGDFSVGKVHSDIKKIIGVAANGGHWFLAFFRQVIPTDPWQEIKASYRRKNGLNHNLVGAKKSLTGTFQVYRPDGQHDTFGFALLKGLKHGTHVVR